MIHDDVGSHLPQAGSFDRAAAPLGMYVAWLANHQLLSEALCERAASLVVRVRYREVTGSELALSGCAGVLDDEHLNAEGRAFTVHYYPRYMDDFRHVFGQDPYGVEDDWGQYDRIAPTLTEALVRFRGSRGTGSRGSQPWWKFWR